MKARRPHSAFRGIAAALPCDTWSALFPSLLPAPEDGSFAPSAMEFGRDPLVRTMSGMTAIDGMVFNDAAALEALISP